MVVDCIAQALHSPILQRRKRVTSEHSEHCVTLTTTRRNPHERAMSRLSAVCIRVSRPRARRTMQSGRLVVSSATRRATALGGVRLATSCRAFVRTTCSPTTFEFHMHALVGQPSPPRPTNRTLPPQRRGCGTFLSHHQTPPLTHVGAPCSALPRRCDEPDDTLTLSLTLPTR